MRKLLSFVLFLALLGAGSLAAYAAFCRDSGGNRFCGQTCSTSGESCSCTGECSKAELEAIMN